MLSVRRSLAVRALSCHSQRLLKKATKVRGLVTASKPRWAPPLPRNPTDWSASQLPTPPFPTALLYNQSKHACQSILADLRAVWGSKIRVMQVLEAGEHALPGIDGAIYIKKKSWGDMHHFMQRLDASCTLDPTFAEQRKKGEVVFMPGWSAFAESAETARQVTSLGLVWPGTEPNASERLEKIGFKKICLEVGAPTPPFRVLSDEGQSENISDKATREAVVEKFLNLIEEMKCTEPGLVKSIHGGGGKGTAHLKEPADPVQARAAVEKVLNEMKRSDGIYFEQRVNTKGDGRFFQLELEVDGDVVSHGGRFVWFNSRLQKVVEIGMSDSQIQRFMPMDLYKQARKWSSQIARKAGNNTRATMEALVFKDVDGKHRIEFIECNRRPQVENEALALLQEDSSGNRRYTFAELMMRAAGHPVPQFQPAQNVQVVLHARWLHGNPDHEGNIAYQPGSVVGMVGPRLDWVASEVIAPGEISFTSDPQLGKAVIVASSWEQMCARGADYFKLRRPSIKGSASTYAQTMHNLFASPAFRAGTVASNETFAALDIPLYPARTLAALLQEQLSPIMVLGYRGGEGIDANRWPTNEVCDNLAGISAVLRSQTVARPTMFARYTRGEVPLSHYIDQLRSQLSDQGGAWVTVAPRDTAQQGNDSESAGITSISRRNAEVWGERAACVGYEIGGAQYQAALMRGFDPAAVLVLGLPYNMPAHSLQRAQYVNGLSELPSNVRVPLFEANAGLVRAHYSRQSANDVPWFPYNFHAGNFFDPATGYSPQDLTTGELLKAKCTPIPNWVFSAKFTLDQLAAWTGRQIDLFAAAGRTLHQVRIKNPGQGADWTADTVWAHVQVIRKVFKERGEDPPIVYIHNHDFNGLGGHIGRELFLKAQADGFNNLIIDGAYRKNGTHNDNTVLLSALRLSPEQRDALAEYNMLQQRIEQVLTRFDGRNSQMTPWNSDWAGGTEGSDLRIAKEYGLEPRQINYAKEVANEVFPLERAVTPFSEYKLRLGIAIMIEEEIEPKTAANVREFISRGGKLKVGGDVLVGLSRWETLVPKPEVVNELLANMKDELNAALEQSGKLIETTPVHFSTSQRFTALGFQQKGMDFIRAQGEGKDLTPLLTAPQILHRKPRTTLPGTRMTLFINNERTKIDFLGFGTSPSGDITLGFRHAGEDITVTHPDPNNANKTVVAKGRRKADPTNKSHYGTVVPGELLSYSVSVGDILEKGKPLCVLESMKMEVKISVPEVCHGMQVVALPCRGRTAVLQGDILSPGDLLVEMKPAE